MKDYFSSINQAENVGIPSNIEVGSTDYITYIFYSCLLDYWMRSKTYHANLINTYKVYKNVFNPQFVVENYKKDEEKLLSIIKNNIHPRYPNIALKKWIKLSIFLNDNYPGNKLKNRIIALNSYKELYNFITSIKDKKQEVYYLDLFMNQAFVVLKMSFKIFL